MSDIETATEELEEQFEEYIDTDEYGVEGKIRQLVENFSVPVEEAQQVVENGLIKEAGIERDDLYDGSVSGNRDALVNDVDEDGEWVNVTAKFVDEWEPRNDSISQIGLLGDESGRNKFVAFESSELEQLEEGESYRLSNVVVDEYQGDYSLKLNRTTSIEKLDDDIEVGDGSETIDAPVVNVTQKSGLIERCPKEGCTRVLTDSRCSEHGEVDGEHDLRIIAHLDTGDDVVTTVFNREQTESVLGYDLETALEKAQAEMDMGVIRDEIAARIRGNYFMVEGSFAGDYFLVNSYSESNSEKPSVEAVLEKAQSEVA